MLERIASCPGPNFPRRRRLRLVATLLLLSLWAQPSSQTYARAYGLRQSPPQPAPQEAATLELGKPVERELAGGQKHVYQLALTEGQFISVEIKVRGMDARLTLQPPGGDPVQVLIAPATVQKALFHRVSKQSGIHRVAVHARAKTPAGRYEIRLAELRPATEDDRALQQARELIDEAIRLNRTGKRAESRPLLIRALEIRERLWPDGRGVVQALNMLAFNFEDAGDYASAEPLHLRALKILEKAFGPEHPEVADQLKDLGTLYLKRGDDIKAEEMYQRSLAIFEKAQRGEAPVVASLLGARGEIAYARGDYESAGRYYERSRALWEKILGPDSFHLEPTFVHLGRVAYDAGDYAKAEAMFGRALALREKAFGPEGAGIPWRLGDLAMLHSTTGDYAKAESLYLRALAIHEKAGPGDPSAHNTLHGLARLYAAQGRAAEALKFQARASELEERYVGLNLAAGSEREKLAFLDQLSLLSSRHVTLHTRLAPHDPAARDLALTAVLRRKGRAQDAMSESLAALRRRSGAEDRALLDELGGTTSRLARLILDGPPHGTTPAEHQNRIKALEEQRERLEAEVSRRSAGFYERARPVTPEAVQGAIPAEAALVEFAVYRPFDPKAPDTEKAYGEPRYVAYVVRRQGEARWAELGPAAEVDAAVDDLRRALREPRSRDARGLARAFDERLMRTVRALAGDAAQLLVSPDGALNLIPFEALVDERGRYLVERYAFTYLTSGRDLLRTRPERAAGGRPVVLANPSFDKHAAVQTASVTRPPAPGNGRRGVTAARTLSETYFAPLGGTAEEARAIHALFPDASLLTGERATESALKGLSAPRLLHVATHGFFLQDSETHAAARPQAAGHGAGANVGLRNPLLRSGLALAGANLRAGAVGDDGILTALEASGLNLWGTKLAVLSACDTGLGEVRNGEGVYGLRRALVLAGAESLVMSLWPASDYSTRRLMASYYQTLKQGMGRGAALRRVQLDMLKRDRQLHPFYWANFIQSGEWASLDGRR